MKRYRRKQLGMAKTMTKDSIYETWLAELSIERVRSILSSLRCETVLLKYLQRNNNSKNQIYLAPTANHLAGLPLGTPVPSPGSSMKKGGNAGSLFTIPLPFSWISPSGVVRAPDAKLCDYPQYPEVRFSGFLKGCSDPPSHLLTKEKRGTEEGRILLIGVSRSTGECYGLVVPATVALNNALRSIPTERQGILEIWSLADSYSGDSRSQLLKRLCEVSHQDWIPSKRLTKDGLVPYRARNGGGYTLEAELGIVSNSKAGPDYHGWEVKQHGVNSLARPRRSEVTLFDIAPDGGQYTELGPVEFGFLRGRTKPSTDRFDFTGKHRGSKRVESTGLHLEILGFEGSRIDPNGSIRLQDDSGLTAMSWSFTKLVKHWNRKHAQAAFIGSEKRDVTADSLRTREYRYAQQVELGTGTDFSKFLSAIKKGSIAFDPGIKVEREKSGEWKSHARYPFRISSGDLHSLYADFEIVNACSQS
jgi:hypothetical protein